MSTISRQVTPGCRRLRIEPIELDIAAVADGQARLAVEDAHALRQGFDRGAAAAGFLGEASDLVLLPARGGQVCVVGGAQQAREGGVAGRGLLGAAQSFRAQLKTLQRSSRRSRRRVVFPPKPFER